MTTPQQYPYAIAKYFTIQARREAVNKQYTESPQHDATILRRYTIHHLAFQEEFCPLGVMIVYETPDYENPAPSSSRVRDYIAKRDHLSYHNPALADAQQAAADFLSDWDSNIIPTHLLAAALNITSENS